MGHQRGQRGGAVVHRDELRLVAQALDRDQEVAQEHRDPRRVARAMEPLAVVIDVAHLDGERLRERVGGAGRVDQQAIGEHLVDRDPEAIEDNSSKSR
jgi:hypothetical protein